MADWINVVLLIVAIHLQIHSGESTHCTGRGWESAVEYDGYCYSLTDDHYHFSEARQHCNSIGGELTSIHSSSENQVNTDLCSEYYCWLGLRHLESGSWEWIDGTTNDYKNWTSEYQEERGKCVFIDWVSGKWTSTYMCNEQTFYGICKKPAYEITSTTSTTSQPSSTSSGPLPIQGCDQFFREECPQNDSEIVASHGYDPVQCQELCQFHHDCKSFTYDHEAQKCYLYSSPVTDVNSCSVVGGPDDPAFDICQDNGCQDFYQSSCNDEDLITLTVTEGFNDIMSCQTYCQENYRCEEWTVVNQTTCKLFLNQPRCSKFTGPRDTPIKSCFK